MNRQSPPLSTDPPSTDPLSTDPLPPLAHALQACSWRHLRRLMATHGLPTGRDQRKADLVATLAQRLNHRAMLETIIPQLSALAYQALHLLIAANGTLPTHRFTDQFGPFPAAGAAPSVTAAAPPAPTTELVHWGLLYRHRADRYSHEALVLPAELFTHLQPLLQQAARSSSQHLLWWERPGEPPDLLWHLGVWLATVASEAVRPLHGRWLPPRIVALLSKRIGLDQDPTFVPRRSERHLPYLAFLHFLAESAGFVEGTTHLTLTPTAWQWLAAPLAERRDTLWHAWHNAPAALTDPYREACGALAPQARHLLLETLHTLIANGTLPTATAAENVLTLPLTQLVNQLRLHDPWQRLPGADLWPATLLEDPTPDDLLLLEHNPHGGFAVEGKDEVAHGLEYELWEDGLDEGMHQPAPMADPLAEYCTGPLFWLAILDVAHAPVHAPTIEQTTDQGRTPTFETPQVRLGRHGQQWLANQDGDVLWPFAAPQPVHSHKDAADLYSVTSLVQPLHLATLARLCRWETVAGAPFQFQLYLDDHKVAQAAAQGLTIAEMVHDLTAALARPLSRRELQRLRARVRGGQQAHLRTLTVLETADAATMATLRRRKLVRNRLGPPVGPNRVEVNPADASALAQTLATLGLALHVPPEISAVAELQPERGTELAPTFQWMLLQIYKGLGEHAALPVKAPWWGEQTLATQLSPVQRAAATAAARQVLEQIRSALDGHLRIPAWQIAQEQDSGALRQTLDAAIANEQPLTIRYWTSTHGEPITRTITPYWIEQRYDTDYLVAYCHLRNEERTFRVDRIAEIAG